MIHGYLGLLKLLANKNSIVTTVETDIQTLLATTKTKIDTLGTNVTTAYADVSPMIRAAYLGQSGNIYTTVNATPASIASQWNKQIGIEPGLGDTNLFLYAYVDVTLPTGTNDEAYIGVMSYNDIIGSITTLSSIPSFATVYGYSKNTAFANPLGFTNAGGVLYPSTQRIAFPFYGVRLGTNGIAIYTWSNGNAGFSIDKIGVVYRNEDQYTNT